MKQIIIMLILILLSTAVLAEELYYAEQKLIVYPIDIYAVKMRFYPVHPPKLIGYFSLATNLGIGDPLSFHLNGYFSW